MVTLTQHAQEGSSFAVVANFVQRYSSGAPDQPITPNDGLAWSLFRENGTIVNNRESVPIGAASSVTIVLYGADLALLGGYPEKRFLVLEGTYDSLLGNNLPIRVEISFLVENLMGE